LKAKATGLGAEGEGIAGEGLCKGPGGRQQQESGSVRPTETKGKGSWREEAFDIGPIVAQREKREGCPRSWTKWLLSEKGTTPGKKSDPISPNFRPGEKLYPV